MALKQSLWVWYIIICHISPPWGHLSTPSGPKRPFWGPRGPRRVLEVLGRPRGLFGGFVGPWKALGDPIWAQMPAINPPRYAASMSCALGAHIPTKFFGPPKGPPGAKTSPSGGPRSTVEVPEGPEHMKWMSPTQLDQRHGRFSTSFVLKNDSSPNLSS